MKKHWDNPATHPMPAHARVPSELRIGPLRVAPATVLAPMAGVTDTVFRRFIKNASVFSASAPANLSDAVNAPVSNQSSGCGLIMTEFTSADGLSRMRHTKRRRYLTFYDDEHPISAQLFGSNPDTLADAARVVQDSGFDAVDLNLGCPAKRVVHCNGGSGLLRDLPAIERIFRAIRAAVTIPFTVKFRLGWDDRNIICVQLARIAEDCGLNALALHARTREQGYSGQARWQHIAEVKQSVRIPVIGNGDVLTPEDACALVAQTNCDAVMIGRAAPANPWIFRQIAQYTATGRYDTPTELDRYRMIRTYFEMLTTEFVEESAIQASLARSLGEPVLTQKELDKSRREAVGKMKQFASWFTHGVPGGAALRRAIYTSTNGDAVLAAVEHFFDRRLNHPDQIDPTAEAAIAKQELLDSTAAYCE